MSSNTDSGEKPTDDSYSQSNSSDGDVQSIDMLSGDREGSGDLSKWEEVSRDVPTGGDWQQVTTVTYENPTADYQMEVRAIPRDSTGQTVEYLVELSQSYLGDDTFNISVFSRAGWKGTKRGLTDDIDGLVKEIQLRFSKGDGDGGEHESPHIPLGPSTVDGETNQWNIPKGPEADGTLDHWEHHGPSMEPEQRSQMPVHVFTNEVNNYDIALRKSNTNVVEEDGQAWDASITHYEETPIESEGYVQHVSKTTLWEGEVTVSGDAESATEALRVEYSDQTEEVEDTHVF